MAMLTLDTQTVINTLLDKDVTPETVDLINKRLDEIIMPWRPDSSVPPSYQRKTGNGDVVAIVTARLGEFTWAHTPRNHGWGYRANIGHHYESGIMRVEWDPGMSEKLILTAERLAMEQAMAKCDAFLKKGTRLVLDAPLKVGK